MLEALVYDHQSVRVGVIFRAQVLVSFRACDTTATTQQGKATGRTFLHSGVLGWMFRRFVEPPSPDRKRLHTNSSCTIDAQELGPTMLSCHLALDTLGPPSKKAPYHYSSALNFMFLLSSRSFVLLLLLFLSLLLFVFFLLVLLFL